MSRSGIHDQFHARHQHHSLQIGLNANRAKAVWQGLFKASLSLQLGKGPPGTQGVNYLPELQIVVTPKACTARGTNRSVNKACMYVPAQASNRLEACGNRELFGGDQFPRSQPFNDLGPLTPHYVSNCSAHKDAMYRQ
jgi:hypothetical protein